MKRDIAILTDIHGLLEPLEAILDDTKKRGITEVYSLGDNIGLGPNPREVMDLLMDNGVKCIAGNYEEYINLGTEPFRYLDSTRIADVDWTKRKLSPRHIEFLKVMPKFYEIIVGNKKIALCHFANDVRIDFGSRSTWSYQSSHGDNSQFAYTNSEAQKKEVIELAKRAGEFYNGYRSYQNAPLFDGKTVDYYDEIIQGHVHFKMLSEDSVAKIRRSIFKRMVEEKNTRFRTIRAAGMAYGSDSKDLASYIIVHIDGNDYTVEEVLVEYNRDKMIRSVNASDDPCDKMKGFVR